MDMSNRLKEKVNDEIERWMIQESADDMEDFRQEWVKEGINLYEKLKKCRLSRKERIGTYYALAKLYLEYGRSEKMISGNKHRAFKYLQSAAKISETSSGDSFYHLAFLVETMTLGREKWESAAFYAKEALERDLDVDKQIKIYCLLGKAYAKLGFKESAAKSFDKSTKLDKWDEYSRFRNNYSKEDNRRSKFARLNPLGINLSKYEYHKQLIERSKTNNCYVLLFNRNGAILYGNNDSVPLTVRQSEILRLIFESNRGLTKDEIFHNTVGIGTRSRSPDSVKTDISRLRSLLRKRLQTMEQLIKTVGERGNKRYQWTTKIEQHILDH